MEIPFSKLSGSGNDFIIINNLTGFLDVEDFRKKIPLVCRRRISVGADGIIIIEKSTKAHFKWLFFNSDGSEAEMCGNGGRCVARFAYEKGIAPQKLSFETLAGIIKAEVKGREVKVEMIKPFGLKIDKKLKLNDIEITYSFLNTGVPHVVIFVDDLERVNVKEIGRKIRFHKEFEPAGTNVNFVSAKDGTLFIRTYERGVEEETLACGTGATAAALVAIEKKIASSPVKVITKSGETLKIYKEENRVFLEGLTRWVYDGVLKEESWL